MMLKPIFHELAEKNSCPRIAFCAVNVMTNREAAGLHGIMSIPALRFYYRVCWMDTSR